MTGSDEEPSKKKLKARSVSPEKLRASEGRAYEGLAAVSQGSAESAECVKVLADADFQCGARKGGVDECERQQTDPVVDVVVLATPPAVGEDAHADGVDPATSPAVVEDGAVHPDGAVLSTLPSVVEDGAVHADGAVPSTPPAVVEDGAVPVPSTPPAVVYDGAVHADGVAAATPPAVVEDDSGGADAGGGGDADQLHLRIRFPSGEVVCTMRVLASSSLDVVCSHISRVATIPIYKQRFLYGTQELQDLQLLRDRVGAGGVDITLLRRSISEVIGLDPRPPTRLPSYEDRIPGLPPRDPIEEQLEMWDFIWDP